MDKRLDCTPEPRVFLSYLKRLGEVFNRNHGHRVLHCITVTASLYLEYTIPMAYYSPYQPDKNDFKRVAVQAGTSILEKTIIFGAQLIKFVVQFVIDALKQVVGK